MVLKKLNKKGIFFTIISILAVTILFIAFTSKEYMTGIDRAPVIKDRIIKADNFVRNLKDSYIERVVRFSSYRTLRALTLYIETQSTFFDTPEEFENAFESVILTGNIITESGTKKIDDIIGQPIMQGNTLLERLEDVENASGRILFIETDFDVININLYQNSNTSHWYVGVDLNISYIVNSSIAFWQNNILVTSFLSILGLEDPYYYVMSGGVVNIIENELDNTTTDYLTSNFLWNLTYLKKHINQTTYKPEGQAPSFLMRFMSNTGASACCGIESIIYHKVDKNMTYIDYCFWNKCPGSDPDGDYSLYNITNITTPEYPFKLEPYHWQQYNVSEYAVWTNVTP